jgi:hypothetical protein
MNYEAEAENLKVGQKVRLSFGRNTVHIPVGTLETPISYVILVCFVIVPHRTFQPARKAAKLNAICEPVV